MRICDSAGGKWDREQVESKDTWICHWGNEGLQGSVLSTSSCLTNGWWVFRIELQTGEDHIWKTQIWMWPLSFLYSFIFIQFAFLHIELCLNSGLPLFLAISPARFPSTQSFPAFPFPFGIHLLSLHHQARFVCLSIVSVPTLLSSILPFVFLFPLLIYPFFSYPHAHISLSIHFSASFSQVAEQISA